MSSKLNKEVNSIIKNKITIINIIPLIILLFFVFLSIYLVSNFQHDLNAANTNSTQVTQTEYPRIDGPKVIYKHRDYIINSEFYLKYFSAIDHNHNDLSNHIQIIDDDYKGNANKNGSYDVTLSVQDSNDNINQVDLTIIVTSNIKPYIIVDNDHFVLSPDNQMSKTEIISTLKEINEIPNQTFVFDTIFDNYTRNANSIGTYNHSFHLLSEAGEEYFFYLTFENIESDHYLIDASPTFFSRILNFFTSWWWLLPLPIIITIGIIKK